MTGRDFDNQLRLGSQFISLNISSLGQEYNSSANVSLTGVDCSAFTLYHATGFQTSLAGLLTAGTLVATQANLNSDCSDSSLCINLKCSDSTLNFTVIHFDGFGDGGGSSNTPEFSTFTLALALGIVILGMAYMRNRHDPR